MTIIWGNFSVYSWVAQTKMLDLHDTIFFNSIYRVIDLESSYLDAYWHRHFLFILRGDYSSALDDLNFILDRKPDYKIYMALWVYKLINYFSDLAFSISSSNTFCSVVLIKLKVIFWFHLLSSQLASSAIKNSSARNT